MARRLSIFCLLFTFLFSALLPFYAIYQWPVSNSSVTQNSEDDLDQMVLICAADGFKLVSLADLITGKYQHKPDSDLKCPLCYLANKDFSPEHPLRMITLAAAPTAERLVLPTEYDMPITEETYYHHYPSQAPPTPSVS